MTVPKDTLDWLLACSGLFALWVGWIWKFRPRWRRFWSRIDTFFDTFNGREATIDDVTGLRVPAVPALGTRLGNIETALLELAQHRSDIDDLQDRVVTLEQARAERLVNQFETGQMLRMAADEQGKPPADHINPPPKEKP